MKTSDTNVRIKQKVLELMKSEAIDKIKVTEVTDHLGISRGTFYQYYDSVFAVVQEIEDDFFADWKPILEMNMAFPFDDRFFDTPHPGILATFKHLRKNGDILQRLLYDAAEPTFRQRFRKTGENIFMKAINEGYIDEGEGTEELICKFLNSACLGSMTHMATEKFPLSDEEIVLLMYRMIFGSFRFKRMK